MMSESFEQSIFPKAAFVDAAPDTVPSADSLAHTLGCSYVNIGDLIETIRSFFDLTIDNFSAQCICRDLRYWDLENTLWGQVDSSSLQSALNSLPRSQQAAIFVHFDADQLSMSFLEAVKPVHISLGDFLSRELSAALDNIAAILHQDLD